ncbi:methyltransferase domain-containing protein [uncultured Phycicoccus sp.]|uniref:methyltransferase domain-containing protein n=1 Tax=uncultured Phycicoccus sp. TaxID=661422 RepID=UPI00345C2D8F
MTSSDLWDDARAARYDEVSAAMFRPEVLDPVVDTLAELAGNGRALELAIGTGRVAIPLAARGVDVAGIELSQPMVDRLHVTMPGLPVVVGDMATTVAPGRFALVYLVYNTIGNLRTQDEQSPASRTPPATSLPGAASSSRWASRPCGAPPGQSAVPFDLSADHVAVDTYDVETQEAVSHHYTREDDGSFRYLAHHYRYVWPAELDLMARLAGMTLERRTADWHGAPFTGDSTAHVSVWRVPG